MTPEKQRIAIAESCGWRCEVIGAGWCVYRPNGTIESSGRRADYDVQSLTDYIRTFYGPLHSYLKHPLPDYLNDLNAIREAVLHLGEQQRREYALWLTDLTRGGPYFPTTYDELFPIITATAEQCVEAFLRTINGKRYDCQHG